MPSDDDATTMGDPLIKRVSRTAMLTGLILVSGPLVAMAPAQAVTPASVSILSPVSGATIHGVVDVTVHVVPGSTPVTQVTAQVQDVNGKTLTRSNAVPSGCGAGCDVTVSLDTGAATSDDPAGWILNDSQSQVLAWVDPAAPVSEPVTLLNDRPMITCPAFGSAGFTTCTSTNIIGQAGTWDISLPIAPGGTGSPVSSVVFAPAAGGAPLTLTQSTPGTWTTSVDVSALASAENLAIGTVVATDARGISAQAMTLIATVDRVLTITPDLTGPVYDSQCLQVSAAHDTVDGGLGAVRINTVTTWIDGVQVNKDQVFPSGSTVLHQPDAFGDCAQTVVQNVYKLPMPTGVHQVTITAGDTAGNTGTWTGTITIVPSLDTTITISPDGDLHKDAPVTLTSHTAITGTQVNDIIITDSAPAATIAFGSTMSDAGKQADLTHQWWPSTYGTHTLTWTAYTNNGTIYTYTRPVKVLPEATAGLIAPKATTPGHRQVIAATVRLASGGVAAGASASLQYAPYRSTAWSTVATATTNTAGGVAFSVIARRAGSYRVVTADTVHTWWGTAGPALLVKALPVVGLSVKVTSAGHVTASVSGSYAPAGTKVSLWVNKSGRWVVVATGTLSSKGRWAKAIALTHRHKWQIRASLSMTATSAPATSPTRIVTP